ncbi:zinc knuckle CX2CX4HX4C containing protein [Tanacetum coccineum]
MINTKGMFFFTFASIDEMKGVLENGPWFIRSAPIILKKWTLNANILKSWGRLNYFCVLIDIRVDQELKDNMIIVIPNLEGNGYVLHTVWVEYEWKPPRCKVCKQSVLRMDDRVSTCSMEKEIL